MASQTSSQPPSLSSFLTAAREWLEEDYASAVVRQVLDSRDHIPAETKRALDAAIRNSGLRVPGAAFQLQDVQDAPTHHLLTPVYRKMEASDELTEAVLRAWVVIKAELYESVVQHLQWNDEPTYGPDRKERSFRGYWDARDWQANFNQFMADRTGFERNDVGLMLWYVSGKLPPPASQVEDSSERVDFEKWKELLMALPSASPQWDVALEFAAAVSEIRDEKEKQRARDAVNQLKRKLEDIWLEYSDELIYLEKNIGLWASARTIQPEVAIETLAQVVNLESLLSQYRPIRDQAQSRSVESSRAGRRAELEAQIISTVVDLEPLLSPGEGAMLFEALATETAMPSQLGYELISESGFEPQLEPASQVESELMVETDLARESETFPGLVPELAQDVVPELAQDAVPETLPEALETGLDLLQGAEPELVVITDEAGAESQTEELAVGDIAECDTEPETLTTGAETWKDSGTSEPAQAMDTAEAENPPGEEFNASILAGLRSLRQDLDLLKAQLATTGEAGPPEVDVSEDDTHRPVNGEAGSAEADGLTAVVLEAQERFPRQLVFRLNAESWVNGNPYEDPEAVTDALEWLATTYVPARLGELDFNGLNDSLYRACRWKYSNNQHDRSFFQNEGRYRMLVNGKAYYLNETIGRGAGQDPVNTIRIAFYWDRHRERVVIGYIGQHEISAES